MTPGQQLVYLVDAAYKTHKEQVEGEDGMRRHLGASVIGDKCLRKLWYGFHWAAREETEGRMYRLWDRGHKEEATFVDLLRKVGATVWTHDANGDQFKLSALGGHFGGSNDGVAQNLPYQPAGKNFLLECKTHNSKWFSKLASGGVKKEFPKHYRQAQVYMHHMPGPLRSCLYMGVNKDTDELYFEFFDYDAQEAEYMMRRAETIIFGEGIPPGISTTPGYWECRFCFAREVCFKMKVAKVNCRTCAHSRPEADGTWSCGQGKEEIGTQPKQGCAMHTFIPELKSS